MKRPIELIRFLEKTLGGSWEKLAKEYEGLHKTLSALERSLAQIRSQRADLYAEIRQLRVDRLAAEAAKGDHFRAKIFNQHPSHEDMAERERLAQSVVNITHAGVEVRNRMVQLRHTQKDLVEDESIRKIHERRRSIELEAELKRLRLIRQAIISSKGLTHANLRPSAWWFPLVCPDGLWFRETIDTAECYLEPLV